MLVLRRREGDWTRIEHVESGDVLWVRVREIGGKREQCQLVWDDDAKRFDIQRPERQRVERSE
jgi:hypothetical protein